MEEVTPRFPKIWSSRFRFPSILSTNYDAMTMLRHHSNKNYPQYGTFA